MLDRTPIQIPPGVMRAGSEAEMTGHWYDTQLVRWIDGVMRPVAGWEKIILEDVVPASKIRAMHTWLDLQGVKRTALLCDGHLYVLEGNTLTDISPTVAITAPPEDVTLGGYGDNAYSYGTYGTARPAHQRRLLVGPCFTLDNWGEWLVAMVSTDGRLLRWKPGDPPGTVSEAMPNAPVGNRTFVVTHERHIMLFQMEGKPNRFGWCNQELPEDWDFANPLSMAGYYDIEPAGPISAAVSTRFGVLFFTPAGAYLSRYLSVPYIYSLDPLGSYAAPLANSMLVKLSDMVVWPATDGFWSFNGSVIGTVPCPLLDWFQRMANTTYLPICGAGMYLGAQTEAWWFFPSNDLKYNDRYLMWNYQDKWWSMGQLSRTCGVPGSPIDFPLMSDGANVYRHEYGLFYYDAPVLPYAQSAAVNIANGAKNVTASKGIADTRAPANDVQFFIGARKGRIMGSVPPMRLKGPYHVRPDGKVDFRVTGRDLVIRIQSTRSGVEPWTFGQMLVRLAPRGQR